VEPIQTRRKTAILLIVLVVIAGAAALAVFRLTGKTIPVTALTQLIRSDLPILDLDLQFVTTRGQEISSGETKLGKGGRAAKAQASPDKTCPDLIGGDTDSRTLGPESQKRGENCAKIARWVVKRHPIGLSLYFQDGMEVLSLFEDNSKVNELFQNRFFQGIFHEPLRDAGIRAEDLRLEGLEGAFLRTVLREALTADAQLHYDIAHGKRGFVFSFVREKCAYFAKALPVMARVLSRSGYRIPALPELILEMRIGLQRLFLTQVEGRVYLANGLEALINVLESLPPAAKAIDKMPLVLAIRSEAFVANILPVMVGAPEWELQVGFGVSEKSSGLFTFPAGKLTRALNPKIYKGIPASIPQDVFAALVTSYALPTDMADEEWQRIVTEGPGAITADHPSEAGFALIWDLDAETEGITQMGVVIANQKKPEAAEKFKKYFRDPQRTAECGGGTVFLAATSEKLLVRMKESCRGQSLSVLDWQNGEQAKLFDTTQLFFFANSGSGMRELFLAGGAASGGEIGDFAPQWKKEYEQAKAAMRQDGEKVINALPIFAYSGAAAEGAKTVVLQGYTVKQGGAK